MGDIIVTFPAAVALWVIVGMCVAGGINRVPGISMTGSTFWAAVIIWPWLIILGLVGIVRGAWDAVRQWRST